VLDPAGERYAFAMQHQRECAACRRYVLSLRGLAVVLPPVLLPPGVIGGATGMGVGAGAGGGAGAAGGTAAGGAGGTWGFLGGSLGAKLAGGLAALGLAVGGAALAPADGGPGVAGARGEGAAAGTPGWASALGALAPAAGAQRQDTAGMWSAEPALGSAAPLAPATGATAPPRSGASHGDEVVGEEFGIEAVTLARTRRATAMGGPTRSGGEGAVMRAEPTSLDQMVGSRPATLSGASARVPGGAAPRSVAATAPHVGGGPGEFSFE